MPKKSKSKPTGGGEFELNPELRALLGSGVIVDSGPVANPEIVEAAVYEKPKNPNPILSTESITIAVKPLELNFELGRELARSGSAEDVVTRILEDLQTNFEPTLTPEEFQTVSQFIRGIASAGAEAVIRAFQTSQTERPATPTARALQGSLNRLANYFYFTSPESIMQDTTPKSVSFNVVSFYSSLRDRVLTAAKTVGEDAAERLLLDVGVEPGLVTEVLSEISRGEDWAIYVPYEAEDDGNFLKAQKDRSYFIPPTQLLARLGIESRWVADRNHMISLPPMLTVEVEENFLKLGQPSAEVRFPIVNPGDLADYYRALRGAEVNQPIREFKLGETKDQTIKDLLPSEVVVNRKTDFPIFKQRYKSNETDQLFLGYYIGIIQHSIQEIKQQMQERDQRYQLVIQQLTSRGAAMLATANSHILSNGTPGGQMERLKKCLKVVQTQEEKLLALLFRPPSKRSTAEARRIRLDWQQESLPLLALVVRKSCRFRFHPDFQPRVNFSNTVNDYVEQHRDYPPYLSLNKEASAGPLYDSEIKREQSFFGEVLTQDLVHQYVVQLPPEIIEELICGQPGKCQWAYFKLAFLKAKYEVETREKFLHGTRNYFPSVCGGQISAGLFINASHSDYYFPWQPGCSRTHCLLGFTPYNGGMNQFVRWLNEAELLTQFDAEEQSACMELYRSSKRFLLQHGSSVSASALSPLNKIITWNTEDDLFQRLTPVHKPDLSGFYNNTATITRSGQSETLSGDVPIELMSFLTCVGCHWVVYSDNLYIIWKVVISGAKCPLYEDHLEKVPAGNREYRMFASTDGSKMESCVSKFHAQAWYDVAIEAYKAQNGAGQMDESWEKYLRYFHPNVSFNQHCIFETTQFINPGQGSGIQGTAQFNTSAMAYFAYNWFTLGGTFLIPTLTEQGEEWAFSNGGELAMILCGLQLTIESVINLTAVRIDVASSKNQVLPLDLLGYEAVRATAFEGPDSRSYWPRLKSDRLQRVVCFTDVDRKDNTPQTMNIKQWMLHMSKLASLWLLGGWSFPEIKDTLVVVQSTLRSVFDVRFSGLNEAVPYSEAVISTLLMELGGVRDSSLIGFTMETLISGGFQFMTPYSLYQLYFGQNQGERWLNQIRDLPDGSVIASMVKQKDSIVNSKISLKRVLAASARLLTEVDPLATNADGSLKFPNLVNLTEPRPWLNLTSNREKAARILTEIMDIISIHFQNSPVQQIPTEVMIIPALETKRNSHVYTENETNLAMFRKCFASFWVALTQFCYPTLIPLWLQNDEGLLLELKSEIAKKLLFTHIGRLYRAAVSTIIKLKGAAYERAYDAETSKMLNSSDVATQIFNLESAPLPENMSFELTGRVGKRDREGKPIANEDDPTIIATGLLQLSKNLEPSKSNFQTIAPPSLLMVSKKLMSVVDDAAREELEATRLMDASIQEPLNFYDESQMEKELRDLYDSVRPEEVTDDDEDIDEESVTTSKRPRILEEVMEEEAPPKPGVEQQPAPEKQEEAGPSVQPPRSAPIVRERVNTLAEALADQARRQEQIKAFAAMFAPKEGEDDDALDFELEF